MARQKEISPEELATLQQRKRIAELYLRGLSQWEIGRTVGIHQSNVSRHLAAIKKEWRQSALMDFDERQAQELAKVDKLERTAHGGWLRSCKPAETLYLQTVKGRTRRGKEVTTRPDGSVVKRDIEIPLPDLVKTSKTSRGQAGDPRFLERVGWCISERCKILALIVQKVAPTTPDGKDPYPGDDGPLLAALLRTAGQIAAAGDAGPAEPRRPDAA